MVKLRDAEYHRFVKFCKVNFMLLPWYNGDIKFKMNVIVVGSDWEHDIVIFYVNEAQSNVKLKIISDGNFTITLSPENLLVKKLISKVYSVVSFAIYESGVSLNVVTVAI